MLISILFQYACVDLYLAISNLTSLVMGSDNWRTSKEQQGFTSKQVKSNKS